jgi:transcriptional regulator with GAF, ATPase, and Fis domain
MMSVLHEDEWRRRLNRAAREFSGQSETDSLAWEGSVLVLLREVAETLDVPCAAFVRVPASSGEARLAYRWGEVRTSSAGSWLEAPAVQALIADVTRGGEPLVIPNASGPETEQAVVAAARVPLRAAGVSSVVIVPAGLRPNLAWTWVLGTVDAGPRWPRPVIDHLQMLGGVVAGLLERVRATFGRAERSAPVTPQPIARRGTPSQQPLPLNRQGPEIIGQSPALQTALRMMEEVSDTDCTVLLLGETGTGKEQFARALHQRGRRRTSPLVSVNCGALPPNLIESELFGHQRGAFTGAIAPRLGRFEMAHRGTLFLDEIGDLALDLQAKLLRVLQEGTFERVGSSQTQAADVRIIAATHHDLERAVAEGRFRADLYYRLNVFPIRLPTLRERLEDLPALVWHIIETRQGRLNRHITHVPPDAWEALQQHSWPGNVRELQNVIEGALIHSPTDVLLLREGGLQSATPRADSDTTLTAVDRLHIERVLRDCQWRINGTGNAAEKLGLHPNTLRFRIKKLGIVRHDMVRVGQPLRFRSQSRGVS